MTDYWISGNGKNTRRHLHADQECQHLQNADGIRRPTKYQRENSAFCTTCTDKAAQDNRERPIQFPDGTCPNCGAGEVRNQGYSFTCVNCGETVPNDRILEALDLEPGEELTP
jgi:predicted RNA-binding Zn-ribbon protein involved in translation (DUF1610 family)